MCLYALQFNTEHSTVYGSLHLNNMTDRTRRGNVKCEESDQDEYEDRWMERKNGREREVERQK